MIKTYSYSSLSKVRYEFSKQDILEALVDKFKIDFKGAKTHEFDLEEECHDFETGTLQNPARAELIIHFEKPAKEAPKQTDDNRPGHDVDDLYKD
jgi:hypothetical protein